MGNIVLCCYGTKGANNWESSKKWVNSADEGETALLPFMFWLEQLILNKIVPLFKLAD